MTNLIPAWMDGKLSAVEKLRVHQLGLRHLAVSVFVMDGDKTLLQRRALGKYHTPGLWTNTCCTHPAWGETALDCAQRRLREELGISGLTLMPAGNIEYRSDVGNGLIEHEVVDVFIAQATPKMTLALNPSEVMQTKWTNLDELKTQVQQAPALFTPWLKIYLESGLDLTGPTHLAATS